MKSFLEYITENDFVVARGKTKALGGMTKDEGEAALEREKVIALHKSEGEEIPDFIDVKQGDLDDESTADELRGGHARSDFMAFNSSDQLERRKSIRAMAASPQAGSASAGMAAFPQAGSASAGMAASPQAGSASGY